MAGHYALYQAGRFYSDSGLRTDVYYLGVVRANPGTKAERVSNITSSWIEIHRRTADAVTSFLLTILAVSISSRKVRGGLGLHLAAGMLIGALFILFSKFSITFANSSVVAPALGVWLPNIVFGFLTWVMFTQAQR